MFTGLVECVGTVAKVTSGAGSTRIAVLSSLPVATMTEGESVAVDGVCLTVAERGGDRFHADVVEETLSRTTLGRIEAGARVNLERSLALGDRLGGHLVQGHVDGTAPVLQLSRRGDDCRLRVGLPPELSRFIALKGSVALSGVSLTIAALGEEWLEVALIPETLERTTLGDLGAGDRANVEVDLLARYLDRLLVKSPTP